jgi:hypothetical protein
VRRDRHIQLAWIGLKELRNRLRYQRFRSLELAVYVQDTTPDNRILLQLGRAYRSRTPPIPNIQSRKCPMSKGSGVTPVPWTGKD